MNKRYSSLITYGETADQIDGLLYTLWRNIWMKKRRPLRIRIKGSRKLAAILYKDHWVVVDSKQNDLPLLGWGKFEEKVEKNSPVSCKLIYYHYMAYSWGGSLRNMILKRLKREFREENIPFVR